MSKVIKYLPEIEGDEQVFVARLLKEMNEEQAEQFSHVYRTRRKDETTTLILAVLGFVIVAGVHRFYLGQVGMGLAYLLTAGFCFIGTIVDLVNYKNLVATYNEKQAVDTATVIRGAFPRPPEQLSE